jgi:predicted AAA+ superfamily ATPase
MALIAGPRQVGKTTFALQIAGNKKGYLNWDVPEHRERILRRNLPITPLWVFDELHKYRSWRGYLKGLYDAKKDEQKILVTGSARLDYYRFGGDSLQGRYFFWRLHPLSVAELKIETLKDFIQPKKTPESCLVMGRQTEGLERKFVISRCRRLLSAVVH